ncbi:MAG: hemerythrin domain-containing protein [Deltaproteobacteria bacterium]|nr:hemerythrin domain-containing protein [Deltaproteobacteria bacterium]
MLDLIDTLHAQHDEIAQIVDRVNDATTRGDVESVAKELDALATAVLAHLEVEDSRLYPALTRAAERTQLEVPAKIARTYEHNMQTISIALKAFLEKYSHSFVLDDFKRDWPLVCQLLTDRIASEEQTLYPLYTSWVGGET